MNARMARMFGLAGLGLVATAPVHAAPDGYAAHVWIVAERETERETRRDERGSRQDERRNLRREDEREGPEDYGYGYERRQQHRDDTDDRRDRRDRR